MSNITDETYLLKLKMAGISSASIAQRLGITKEEVERRWQLLQKKMEAMQKSGHQGLINQFTLLCGQYQLMGESLKIIAGALGNEVSTEELKAAIVPDAEKTLENLRSFIILRPFVPISPEESFKRMLEGN